MRRLMFSQVGVVLINALLNPAAAQDSRCSAPPYGGTVDDYRAFVKSFGAMVPPAKILGGVCDAKFGGDRTGLYNLGFTDEDIASESTETLAVDVLKAGRSLMRQQETAQ